MLDKDPVGLFMLLPDDREAAVALLLREGLEIAPGEGHQLLDLAPALLGGHPAVRFDLGFTEHVIMMGGVEREVKERCDRGFWFWVYGLS